MQTAFKHSRNPRVYNTVRFNILVLLEPGFIWILNTIPAMVRDKVDTTGAPWTLDSIFQPPTAIRKQLSRLELSEVEHCQYLIVLASQRTNETRQP